MTDDLRQLFTVDLVRVTGSVTLLLNTFSCYIIVRHSPDGMARYKWILLIITVNNAPSFAGVPDMEHPQRFCFQTVFYKFFNEPV
ncbi:hypothetical protein COOONC_21337 [Cooperia oncophora]